MAFKFNIKEYKNFILITSSGKNKSFELNKSIRGYFAKNKAKHVQYSIISEFVFASADFQFNSKSLCTALEISDKTLKTKLKDLEDNQYLFNFKFSTGKNTSTTYYFVNISPHKISKHIAFLLLTTFFKELTTYSLISYDEVQIDPSTFEDLNKTLPFLKIFKELLPENIKLPKKAEKEMSLSIYKTITDKKGSNLSSTADSIKHFFSNEFLMD